MWVRSWDVVLGGSGVGRWEELEELDRGGGGRRKGRVQRGAAWLLEATVAIGRFAKAHRVCQRRLAGLKDGCVACAEEGWAKMYSRDWGGVAESDG